MGVALGLTLPPLSSHHLLSRHGPRLPLQIKLVQLYVLGHPQGVFLALWIIGKPPVHIQHPPEVGHKVHEAVRPEESDQERGVLLPVEEHLHNATVVVMVIPLHCKPPVVVQELNDEPGLCLADVVLGQLLE